MADPDLRFELREDVACIVLDRPGRLNALTEPMLIAFNSALDEAERAGARALLVTGSGRAFCAGADLADAAERRNDDPAAAMEHHYNPLARRLDGLSMPIVVAVNGVAAGGGCSLALLGDIILMAESAYLLAAFVNIGLAPDFGASWTIARRVGLGRALEMLLLGERIPASMAVEWGLAARVIPNDRLMAEAEALAMRLAKGPTVALGLIRKAARNAMTASFDTALETEIAMLRTTGRTEDVAAAIAAFNRREPVRFAGR